MFRLVISMRGSFIHVDERMRIATKYGLGFDPVYPNEVIEKTTAEQELVRVLFTTYGFMYHLEKFRMLNM